MKKNYKEVRFDIYCGKCKHEKNSEYQNPCNECLGFGCNESSKRPIHFQKK